MNALTRYSTKVSSCSSLFNSLPLTSEDCFEENRRLVMRAMTGWVKTAGRLKQSSTGVMDNGWLQPISSDVEPLEAEEARCQMDRAFKVE
jgi:hypothetical protein